MGNQQFYATARLFRKEGNRNDINIMSSVLFYDDDDLLANLWAHVRDSIRLENVDGEKAIPTNVQRNELEGSDIYLFNAERTFNDINDRFQCGFKTPESHVQDLLEPAHIKYFTVMNNQDNQKVMRENQLTKTKILYGLYLMKKKSGQVKTKTFEEFVTSFLEEEIYDRGSKVGIQAGFGFVMTVLQEMKGMGQILEKTMANVIESLKRCEPGDFYENDRLSFSIDASLNDAREFLIDLIKNGDGKIACLAYKILFLIGLARSCVEDMLLICTFLFNEKRPEIDLRDEIQMLKKIYDKETKAATKEEDFHPGAISDVHKEVEMRICSYGSRRVRPENSIDTWIVDRDIIYQLQEGGGLVKMTSGVQGQMAGKILETNVEYGKGHCTMMLFNGKLYIRHKEMAPKPFIIVDPQTLKEIKQDPEQNFDPKEGDNHSLQWKEQDEDTGRALTYTPLITDGQYLYVIARQFLTKEQQEAEEDNEGPFYPDVVVEVYDPANNFEYIKSVTLYKNKQLDKFKKQSNSLDWLKTTTWATNGTYMVLITQKYKFKFFDLETGIKVHKTKYHYDYSEFGYTYNIQENVFYYFYRSGYLRYKSFKFENFKPKQIAGKADLTELNKKQDQLLSQDNLKTAQINGKSLTDFNVINQLMQGITSNKITHEIQNRQWPRQLAPQEAAMVTRAIVFRFLGLKYKKFISHYEKVNLQEREHDTVMATFRYPMVTYLTQCTFQQITQSLNYQYKLICDQETPQEIELETMLQIMKILNANLQALNFCQVNLASLLIDEGQYNEFMSHFMTGSVFKYSEGTANEQAKASDSQKELWVQIEEVSKEVVAASIKVIHKGPDEILATLNSKLDQGEGYKCQSHISYLSEMPPLRILFGEDVSAPESKLDETLQVFTKICQLESNLLKDQLSLYKVDADVDKEVENERDFKLIGACEHFLTSVAEEINTRYSAKNEEYTRRAKDKKKKIAIPPDEEQNKLAQAVSHISEVVLNELSTCFNVVITELEESCSKKSLTEEAQWEGFKDKFSNYEKMICRVFRQQSAMQQIVITYITSYGLYQKPHNDWTLKLFQGSEIFIKELSRFYTVWKTYGEKMGLGAELKESDRLPYDTTLKNLVGKLHKHISWHIGMMAYKLIKKEPKEKPPPENEDEPDELKKKRKVEKYREQILQTVSRSNLLSGGIETRHLVTFSQQTKNELSAMAMLMDDQEMLKYLSNEKVEIEDADDDILEAVAFSGKNADTEKLITALHNIQKTGLNIEGIDVTFKANMGLAMYGANDGMKITRAAFAIMIKFSDLSDDLQNMQDSVTMADKPMEIKEAVALSVHAEEIINCWYSASQMRPWLQERKSQRADKWNARLKEKAEKQKKDEIKKREEEEAKAKEEAEKKDKKEENKAEGDVPAAEKKDEPEKKESGQIDSSTKPKDAKKEEGEGKEGDKKEGEEKQVDEAKYALTADEKQKVSDEAFDKMSEDIQNIIKKIVEKAAFIIKLNIPQKFKKKDSTKGAKGFTLIKAPSSFRDTDTETFKDAAADAPTVSDWQDRLKQWKINQTKEGTITSLQTQKKEIWDSGITAVQALLQSSIEVNKIQENVEQIYLNASRRCAGFKLISGIISGEMPFSLLENLISWFCSALRMNENKMSHYLDDLTGQGIHLETMSGKFFFEIVKTFVDRLKESKNEYRIKVLLNALKWTYTARDHKELVQLGLFNALHKGSNEKDNLLKKTWGRKLQIHCKSIDRQELNKDVIDTFEQLFYIITGRVVVTDEQDQIIKRQGKNAMPSLSKARSIIDDDVSELLLGQAFDIIFKEFNRYIQIMKGFEGIDWGTYVRKRNQDRYDNGDDLPELVNEDNILLDEVEEPPEEEEKQAEEAPAQPAPEGSALAEAAPAQASPAEAAPAEPGQIAEQPPPAEEGQIVEEPADDVDEEEERRRREEEEQRRKDEEEQKQREQVIKSTKEREAKEFKKLTQLYSENFLQRLLKLVEVFTSIAECKSHPLSMVQKVANPFHMSSLLNLLLLSSPKVKIIVLKIIQHIIKIKIPFEVFEEAVNFLTRDPNSMANRILNKVQPKVRFEKSIFLRFLYNYLLSMRSKMWNIKDAESDGQYAVTLTVSDLLRSLNAMEGSQWSNQIKEETTAALLQIESFPVPETDAIMSLLPGGEYGGMTSGQPAITSNNEYVTILGYSSTWKERTELLKSGQDSDAYNRILQQLSISPEFTDPKQMALTLFYNKDQKERQDLMLLNPSTLSPVIDLDIEKCKQVSKNSPLYDGNVVRHLLSVLKSSDAEGNDGTKASIAAIKFKQSSILKVLSHQIEQLGAEYIEFLNKEGICNEIVQFLFRDVKDQGSQTGTKNTVLPIKWLEAKIQRIRKVAIETSKSLSLQEDDIKAYVMDEKEILFKRTDPRTQDVVRTNAYLCAAFNLHKVAPDAVYHCVMANDMNISGSLEGQVMKNGLVCMTYEELAKLEPRTLSIMNTSEAILVNLPEDAKIEELFKQIVNIFREDADLPFKKRKGYENILETVVFFVDQEDYPDFKKPIQEYSKHVAQIDSATMSTKGPLGKLLKDLKQWGGLDEDEALFNLDPANISDLGAVMTLIQEGIIEKQKEEDKYKESLKNAKQVTDNEEEVKKIEAAEEARLKKRQEVIAEKKKAIQEAQQALEKDKNKPVSDAITEVEVFDEFITTSEWWKELAKVAKDKISVRPSHSSNEGEQKKKTDEQMTKMLWQLMSGFDVGELQVEHSKAINQLLSMQKKACLQDLIYKAEIEQILPFLLIEEGGKKNFAKFIKLQFNSSVIQMLQIGQKSDYQSLKKVMKDIFNFCNNSAQFNDYTMFFFIEEVIKSGVKTIKEFREQNVKNLIDYFQIEERAATGLNPYLLRFFTKYLIKNDSTLLGRNENCKNCLANLLNLHLMMIIYFQGDNELIKKLLKSTLRLIVFCQSHALDLAQSGELNGVIQCKLLNLATKSIFFGYDSDKKFNEQQLFWLEIHLKVDELWKQVNEEFGIKISKILEDSRDISELKQKKQILKEQDNFDLQMYLYHLKNCTQEQKDTMKINLESNNPMFNVMTRSHINMPEVQRMTIRMKDNTKLKPLCYYGISNDPDQEVQLKVSKDKEIQWPSGSVYFFYPLREQSIVCFGINDNNQMGTSVNNNFHEPTISALDPDLSKDFRPIKAWSGHNYTCVLGENGQLVESGNLGSGACSKSQFALATGLKGEIDLVSISYHNMWVLLKDNTLWYKGTSSSYCLPEDSHKSSFTQLKIWENKEDEQKIVDIAAGYMFVFFVTEKGELWARGNDFLTLIKQESVHTVSVNLPEKHLARRVWCTKADYHRVVYVELENEETGKRDLFSAGVSENGLLAQVDEEGAKIRESATLKKINFENNPDISVESLSVYRNGVLVIDNRGKLWGWGKNENFFQGFLEDNKDGLCKPTEIQPLNNLNMRAKKAAICWVHSLILFEDDKGKEVLYSVGINNFKYLGVTSEQLGDDTENQKKKPFREIPAFSDASIADFCVSERASLVIIKEEKGKPSEHIYRHTLSDGSKCQGLLHFYKKDDDMFFIPQHEYEARKDELPQLSLAIKCPIDNIQTKEWPDLTALAAEVLDQAATVIEHEQKDSTTEEPIKGVMYHSRCQINHEEIEVNHNEKEIFLDDKHSLHPLIFYRLAKPMTKGKELPPFDLSKYYKTDPSHLIDFEFVPDLSLQKNNKLIKNTQEQWDELVDNFKKFDPIHKKELLQELDKQIKTHIGSHNLNNVEADKILKIGEMEFKDKDFKKVPEKVKKQQALLYWAINCTCYDILPYRSSALKDFENSFASLVNLNKGTLLSCVKTKVIQREIERLSTGSKCTIKIKRGAAARFIDTGKVDHTGEYTIFGQIYQLCLKRAELFNSFKMNSVDSQMFEVQFAGEGSIDVGGPFRETLTNIVSELESPALPLLIQTVNNRQDHGFYREAWTLNPDANSPTHQQLFKFMGRFLGFNLRTGSAMDWHFTPIFWKQLIGDQIQMKDFDSFDQYALTAFKDLQRNAKKHKPADFDAATDLNFTTILSNQKSVPLCLNGESKKVTHENYEEFIDLVMKARLKESENQMKWLKEGISEVIDINILTFLNWDEIEKRACGGKIETDVLKSITQYRECSADSQIIKWFWQMFDSFTQDERKAYLKFVWGRSKIPMDVSNLNYQHRITLYSYWPNNSLPKSHTCFFMIDIPNYPDYDSMVDKIKYAIETCGEIDDDYGGNDIAGEDA